MNRRFAAAALAGIVSGCGSPVSLQTASPPYPVATPMPTLTEANPTLQVTPNPAQLAEPNSIVKISADGTVTITSPTGQVTLVRVEDLYPSGPRTGIAGSVVDLAGAAVAGAFISTQRPSGDPCKDNDLGISSTDQGVFFVAVRPGPCLIVAGRNGRWSAPVLAEVTADHITPVQLVAP